MATKAIKDEKTVYICPRCQGDPNFDRIVGRACKACDGSGMVPEVVVDSITSSFTDQADSILQSLQWSYDHFSFQRWNTYVGVEKSDGYIHT